MIRKIGEWYKKVRYVLIPIVLVALVFLAQGIFFIYILSDSCQYSQTDAIVVFAGTPSRIEKGYELMRNGYSDHVIISPAKPAVILQYDKKYGWKKSSKHIYETKARTTFENAVYVERLMEKHHFKSVLLVTSIWHMPRSYLLLKTQLLFSGVKIYRVGSDCASNGRPSWWGSPKIRNLVYGEFTQLWGSVGEYFLYLLKGKLSEKNLKDIAIFKGYKQFLH